MHIKIIYEPKGAKDGLTKVNILSCYLPFFYPPNVDRTCHKSVSRFQQRVVNSWELATGHKAILFQAL